jgi:hypothetical protein
MAKMSFRPLRTDSMSPRDDFDPLAPQREAAFFYGLFLRGHSVDALRQDIDVPRVVIDKWVKAKDFQGAFRADLDRVYQYRKRVLAIFDGLVSNEQTHWFFSDWNISGWTSASPFTKIGLPSASLAA